MNATSRRQGLKALGMALAFSTLSGRAGAASLLPAGAGRLAELTKRLKALPRRRDFKTVPMILNSRDQWDAGALDAVLHYAGDPKQSWDSTDLAGPWLNGMRNTINAEVWAFKHPYFLSVAVAHGPAQLALYDDAMWEKYGLAKIAGGNIAGNRFVAAPPAADGDPKDYENPKGPFSAAANSIETLQRRGAVFMACHNAVWELTERLIGAGTNPDKLSAEALCAELTNRLIPGVIVTPGAVPTLVELAKAGFAYTR